MWNKSLGLGILQGWLWLFFISGPLLHKIASATAGRVEAVFFGFLLFSFASYLVLAQKSKILSLVGKKALYVLISSFLISIGTLMVGLTAGENILAIILGTLMAGFGSAILITLWGERYSGLPVQNASLAFALAVAVGTTAFFVIGTFSLVLAIIMTSLLPIVSGILLLRDTAAVTEIDDSEPIPRSASFPFTTRLIVLIVLFYLTGGLMHKLVAAGQTSGFQENYWITNIVYLVVCLLAGCVVFLNPGIDLRLLYRPILPLLGSGFLLLPIFEGTYTIVPFAFLQAGFALFDLYTWILFAYLASHHRVPTTVIAWGMFLITSSIFAGELLFSKILSTVAIHIHETELISLVAAVLMFIGSMVFRDKPETFAGWDYPKNHRESPIHEINSSCINDPSAVGAKFKSEKPVITKSSELSTTVEQFVLHFNLTPRETQILELLLEGRNNPYIREHLNVSNNTLKTHLRNIFRKLSISDRQELLDMVKGLSQN